MLDENNKTRFENYLNLDLLKYLNESRISISEPFKNSIEQLNNEIKVLIDDAVKSVLEYEGEIPTRFVLSLSEYSGRIEHIEKQLNIYNYTKDEANQFVERRKLIDVINNLVNFAFTNNYHSTDSNNLLALYSAIKSFTNKTEGENFNTMLQVYNNFAAEMESLRSQSKAKLDEINTITNILKDRMAQEVVEEYSAIFDNQANRNSKFKFVKKFKFIELGSAEKWFVLGIIFISFFILFVFTMNESFPAYQTINTDRVIDNKIQKIDEYVVNYSHIIAKITVTVILIFVISFSFKQYSVNKHLFTLNKHRANALNTYKLFSKAVSNDDVATKHAIILEVAKAIFEHNITGFIGGKDSEMNSPAFIEFVKYLSSNKQT